MTKEDKQLLHRYGCFTLILLVMFFTLFIFVKLDRKVWNRGLETVVNQVLQSDETTRNLFVLEPVQIETNMASSSALFMVGQNTTVEGYALIVRMTGPSGPVTGVFFTKNAQQPPVFIGTADTYMQNESHRIQRVVSYTNLQLTAAQISFWSGKAAVLFQEVLK